MPDPNSLPDNLDLVLRKYGKIWIWSILSAAVAALSFRALASGSVLQLSAFNTYGAHSQISAAFAFLTLATVAPAIATLVSVCYLLLFLRHHILPILFPAAPTSPTAPTPEPVPESYTAAAPDGAQLLYRAFAAVVVAMALEIAIGLSAAIFHALA